MIVRAAVEGLLGEFDHEISFREDWEFAIAFGLNGVGKTKFLELINAATVPDYAKLGFTRFSRLVLDSDSGSSLQIERTEADEERGKVATLKFRITRSKTKFPAWTHQVVLTPDDEFVRWLSRTTSWVPTDDPFLWEDRSDGEIAELEQLRRMYGQNYSSRRPARATTEKPESFVQFARENRTYLIETQRLGMMSAARSRYGSRSQSSAKWTVDSYANDLKDRLQRALAENSLRSQRLDRSFPERILNTNPTEQDMTVEQLREGFNELDQLRQRLSDIGLTDTENVLPLPERDLDPYQISVLTTYLKDNRDKLSSFDDLRQKIDLLEGLINQRFLRKRIDVSVDRGLAIVTASDGSPIPARGLSSGEQHELVLIYDLLFRVDPGTLVLIDEPEISLHVSWQKKFLNDILRIAESSKLRFVIATHSPTIIGKWWSRTVQLGPTDPEND
ncbi:AAA family ATPase [Microbacterium oxydans]|uniref:AAA family ATPase n=1 Tax=Microbacterium oxydans TaxID=82380 RepID=UPI000F8FA3F2|nr:AAA family ATPase [Microbacterium oxydans]AZS47553.1 hypothetical protein CVS53_02257 [Microbacterium oxydans]